MVVKTKAFYGSRFSPNMTMTPEGFLICHNVPITRTGWYDYLGQELGLEDMFDKIVKVYKSPEEVFAPAAMASFEGKSATDDHPSSDVRPDNYSSFEKGQVTNIRRGTGAEEDCLVADLIIKDPMLISEIQSGKREVSCGYNVDYEPIGDGKYQQVNIRGNHVAVVNAGRAGDRVAIKDEKPVINNKKPTERRNKPMKVDPTTIWGRMLSAFAKDAEPEELAEAAKMAPKTEDSMIPPAPVQSPAPAPAQDEPAAQDPAVAALAQKIDALTAIVAKLAQAEAAEVAQPDALDALTAELGAGQEQAAEENSVTIPAEQMDAAPIVSGEDLPKNPIPGADRNSILSAIRAVKPVIANIKDPVERKTASDALAKTFRDQLGSMTIRPSGPANAYADILVAQQSAAAKAQDSKPQAVDDSQLGRDIAKKYNPHYKEAK